MEWVFYSIWLFHRGTGKKYFHILETPDDCVGSWIHICRSFEEIALGVWIFRIGGVWLQVQGNAHFPFDVLFFSKMMWVVGSLVFLPMTFICLTWPLVSVISAENQLLSPHQPDKALWPVPTEARAAAFFKREALLLNLPFWDCSTVALNFARVFTLMSTEDMVFEDGSEDLKEEYNFGWIWNMPWLLMDIHE